MKIGRLEVIWHKRKPSITRQIRDNYNTIFDLYIIVLIIKPIAILYAFLIGKLGKCSNE